MFRITAAVALFFVSAASAADDSKPIFFRLKVPADATVIIDGHKTTSTGSVRRYETPAMPTGKDYSYSVKVASGGKEVSKTIKFNHTETTIDLTGEFVATGTGTTKPMPNPVGNLKPGPKKAGFTTYEVDGRIWVFRDGSKDVDAFKKDGESIKHVIRPVAGPGGTTVKGPDNDTIVAYLTTADGYETAMADGRLWVFKKGSKEFDAFKKDKDLAKHVIRVNAGPMGMTVKAPDDETLKGYLKAVSK